MIALVLIGYSLTQETNQEVSQLLNSNVEGSVKGKEEISIFDAVKQVKTRNVARSLAGTSSPKAQVDDPMQSYYQFCIWIPIVLFLGLFYSVMSILFMDTGK